MKRYGPRDEVVVQTFPIEWTNSDSAEVCPALVDLVGESKEE
mgnify:CR=1 FL=1